MDDRPLTLIGTRWHDRGSEAAFVVRALAGLASRRGPVSVLVQGVGGPDGAFDLVGLDGSWPTGVPSDTQVVVDELTPEVSALLSEIDPPSVHFVSAGTEVPAPAWHRLTVAGDGGIGLYVPVNPLAERHRHHGFGFTGYHLVLSARTEPVPEPPEAAAWLGAAFPSDDVVVVEDGVASAWRGRALRGQVAVATRMDLWRLLAHASVCVDLGPGRLVAHECVESLRFGTPVLVAAGSGPAERHARASSGTAFGDAAELVEAAGALRDTRVRRAASERGRRYADAWHGDPQAAVDRLDQRLAGN